MSWHRAHDGGQWIRTSESSPPPPLKFSIERVLSFYDEILRRESLWAEFFAARDVKPLPLTYEQVCRDPLAAVRAIANHVGVELHGVDQVHSPLHIVRDEQTADLVQIAARALQARAH